eukprot:1642277-Rhodomonas_salina.1
MHVIRECNKFEVPRVASFNNEHRKTHKAGGFDINNSCRAGDLHPRPVSRNHAETKVMRKE